MSFVLCNTMFYYTILMFSLVITYILSDHSTQQIYYSGLKSNSKDLSTEENNQDKSQWRVIGGENCTTKERWYMVSLRYTGTFQHFCGGSAITQRWILSSAYCLEKVHHNPQLIEVMLGVPSLTNDSVRNLRKVKKIVVHSEFDYKILLNDIALAFLVTDVGFFLPVDELHPKLPPRELNNDLTGQCTTSFATFGWGDIKPDVLFRNESDHLKCVNVHYITNEECLKHTYLARNNKIMCTLSPKGGKDACIGDEGGPLVCDGFLFGIVSWGRECGAPDSPRLYTRVDKHLDFIKHTMEIYKSLGSQLSTNCLILPALLIFCILH